MAEPPASTGFFFPGRDHIRHDIYPAISASQTDSLKQPGKVILITGAGRGIGRAIALQFAHASVAAIILCARTPTQLDEVETSIKQIDPSIRVYKFSLDVTDDAAVSRCASEVTSKEGRLDVLINNAGTSSPWVPIAESDPTKYWNSISINVKGSYLFLHAFLPLLQSTADKYGGTASVVNMSSMGSHTRYPGMSDYTISKGALNTLTHFVDVEYGEKGVQAFAVHPGGVDTDLSKEDETFKKALDGREYRLPIGIL